MTVMTLTIEPDVLLGLTALAELDKADGSDDADPETEARALMRQALATRLDETGLPWAPTADAVGQRTAEATEPAGAVVRLTGSRQVRKSAAAALAIAAAVVLWGGYGRGWQWTGLRANDQLWDWLQILLLPVVLGTIPLWMQDRKYISRGRRVSYAVAIAAWTGFVIAGYLVPQMHWTGFSDQKLGDWLQLLLIPSAVAITTALVSRRGRLPRGGWLRPREVWIAAALTAGWIVTLIGGYALKWTWTGYTDAVGQGHPPLGTMWDWFVLILPMAFPVLLLPPLLKWVTGDADGRAMKAKEAEVADPAISAS
jgi:hypothetical protein